MSTQPVEKTGMSGFKPFVIILGVLIVVSFLLKLLMNWIM